MRRCPGSRKLTRPMAEPSQPDDRRATAAATPPATGQAARRRGFTLLELLVVIAIVAVLAGVALPVLSSTRESGRTAQCVGNLRQIFSALSLYAQDHTNHLPQRYSYLDATGQKIGYCEVILPYVDPGRTPANSDLAKKLFTCPSQKTRNYPADPGYGMNHFYDNASLGTVSPAAQTILLAESAGLTGFGNRNADRDNTQGTTGKLDDTRHRGKANYTFFDGHIELLDYRRTRQPLTGSATDQWGTDAGLSLPIVATP